MLAPPATLKQKSEIFWLSLVCLDIQKKSLTIMLDSEQEVLKFDLNVGTFLFLFLVSGGWPFALLDARGHTEVH